MEDAPNETSTVLVAVVVSGGGSLASLACWVARADPVLVRIGVGCGAVDLLASIEQALQDYCGGLPSPRYSQTMCELGGHCLTHSGDGSNIRFMLERVSSEPRAGRSLRFG